MVEPDDEKKTEAEQKANADEIKRVDATEKGPRGNVFSEPDDGPQHDAPPPLAH